MVARRQQRATIEGGIPLPRLTVPGWHEDPLSMLPLSTALSGYNLQSTFLFLI